MVMESDVLIGSACRLLTVGFHEVRPLFSSIPQKHSNKIQMSHAFVGVLTCARIHSIELDRK